MLEINRVSKLYTEGQVLALNQISFSIKAREFVAILGPSGCGKTTLLRLIAGLERPTDGTIYFQDDLITGTSLDRCYLFQEPRLFPWLKVEDNIKLGNPQGAATKIGIELGLGDFLKAYPHQLSGGMAKRVALARALVTDPQILLLDEPLTNLDLVTRKGLLDLLWQIWHEKQKTFVMVTHDLDEALALATRIIIITPRPGELYTDVKVDLTFPRDHLDPSYIQLRTQLLKWTMEANRHE